MIAAGTINTACADPVYDLAQKYFPQADRMGKFEGEPLWAISLKESGYVGLVDYSQQDFPLVSNIATERFLHDGGFDHTGRYFLVAANVFALPNCAAINPCN